MSKLIKIPFITLIANLLLFVEGLPQEIKTNKDIRVGADKTEVYLPLIQNKKVAIIANQTSITHGTHLVDTLLSLDISVKKVFAPEHGFRGMADAGEHIKSGIDKKTGLPTISLYGDNKKPKPADLADIDVVVFDIQDVGVRFYTYISTMHYVMEACAENNKQFIILDRPNPNGFYVDGPVLNSKHQSFVGMHPIPLVHGLTVGELAEMINEEGWLKNKIKCNLTVILCDNYSHADYYQLPIKPSPNLPNMNSVYLYPSLGMFEGTIVSVGRGTDFPFQVIGHPELKNTTFSFVPKPSNGAKDPMYNGKACYGFDLREIGVNEITNYKKIYLNWLLGTYQNTPDKSTYFLKNNFFNLLTGNSVL